MTIEVLPDIGVDKGTAVEPLLSRVSSVGEVFLGDDRTDISAFAALHRWGREQGRPAFLRGRGKHRSA
mgnify:FL=1